MQEDINRPFVGADHFSYTQSCTVELVAGLKAKAGSYAQLQYLYSKNQ